MCKECFDENGELSLAAREKNADPETRKFLDEHPYVRAFLQNQIDQAKRLGGHTFHLDRLKATEAWDRLTKNASIEDRDILANVFASLCQAQDTLDNPEKFLAHVQKKIAKEGCTKVLGGFAMNMKTGEVRPFSVKGDGDNDDRNIPAPKMDKAEIEELFAKTVTGRGGNA